MSSAFLKSPSVSITNGTKTLTLTGDVDASFVSSGTAVIITASDGTRYDIVEGVSGSSHNSSGISTITLRDNWSFPTVTAGTMTAFNTIEGLRDAIRRARDIASEAGQVTTIFGDIITSTAPTIDVILNGDTIQVTPYGYLQQQSQLLITELQAATTLFTDLQNDVVLLTTDVANQQAIVDANLTASVNAKDAAETAATNADLSAQAAEDSATNAAVSATASINSATASATSATQSSGFADDASNSADASAASATSSQISATASAASATAAATSETNATISATASAASASDAEDSAIASALSAQGAEDERILAETARNAAEAFRDAAEDYSILAASYANYVGFWSSLTGALSIPASVFHNDTFWQLLENVADVTASEPSIANTGWQPIGATVTSVAGKTGNVTLIKDDVGLANADNTSDLNKPISTATQTALNLKANTSALAAVALSGDYDDLIGKPNLDEASAATANTLIRRNGDGDFSVNSPTEPNHPASKAYVDNEIGTDVSALQQAIDDVEILALAGL